MKLATILTLQVICYTFGIKILDYSLTQATTPTHEVGVLIACVIISVTFGSTRWAIEKLITFEISMVSQNNVNSGGGGTSGE